MKTETMRETVQEAISDVVLANDLNIIDFEDFTDVVIEEMWEAFDERMQTVILDKRIREATQD